MRAARLRPDRRCVPPQAAPRIGWASSSRISRGMSQLAPWSLTHVVVRIEIVHQRDQLERQLGLRIAGFLLRFDQVVDRELLVADANRIVGRDLALGEHGQELAHVALQADALLGPQLAFRRHVQQRQSLARPVVAEPADRA